MSSVPASSPWGSVLRQKVQGPHLPRSPTPLSLTGARLGWKLQEPRPSRPLSPPPGAGRCVYSVWLQKGKRTQVQGVLVRSCLLGPARSRVSLHVLRGPGRQAQAEAGGKAWLRLGAGRVDNLPTRGLEMEEERSGEERPGTGCGNLQSWTGCLPRARDAHWRWGGGRGGPSCGCC